MKVQYSHIKIFRQLILLAFILLIPKVHFSQKVTATSRQNLSFGIFYPLGTGGSVIISTSGVRTSTGNIVLLSGGIVSNAIFQVTGDKKARNITNITISNSTLTQVGGGGTLSLNTFITNPTPNIDIRNKTATINVGARLTVGSITANPPGNYIGTFNVTFIYN